MMWAQILLLLLCCFICLGIIQRDNKPKSKVIEDAKNEIGPLPLWLWMSIFSVFFVLLYFAGSFDSVVPSIWE